MSGSHSSWPGLQKLGSCQQLRECLATAYLVGSFLRYGWDSEAASLSSVRATLLCTRVILKHPSGARPRFRTTRSAASRMYSLVTSSCSSARPGLPCDSWMRGFTAVVLEVATRQWATPRTLPPKLRKRTAAPFSHPNWQTRTKYLV